MAAGIPLDLMENFYKPPYGDSMEWIKARDGGPLCHDPRGPILHNWIERYVSPWVPIKWSSLEPDVLHELLDHSDCDGELAAEICGPLADRLEELLPLLPEGDGGGHIGNWRDKTSTFIEGLRLAASRGEAVEFG